MLTPRRRVALLFSISSGLLLVAAGEPLGLGPLAWVALVPLFLAVFREPRWRWSALYGLVAASVFFGVHLWWIYLFGWMAWSALTVFLSLYVAAATLAAGIARRWPLAPVLVAGAWAGMELVRDRWPYGGFPWGALGTTQAGVPGVRWLAGVIGVYGLSFLAAFAAAVIADRIAAKRWALGSVALVGGVLVLFVAADLALGGARPPEGHPVRIGVVQGNVPEIATTGFRDRVVDNHVRLTRELLATEDVDVVVWPEDAVGMGASAESVAAPSELAAEHGTPLLVGRSIPDHQAREFVNAVKHVDGSGRVVEVYEKRHPVPFGEYVPIAFLRRYVTTLEQVPYDMARGSEPVVFEVNGVRVATPVCFESVFPSDLRDFARAGAELHVVSTNNASFGRSPASAQHLTHARMRALELRQWVVQAAISGISGVVAPDGTVSGRTELFTPAVFVAEVEARQATSLYARTGDLFPAGWAAGTALALLLYAATVLGGRRRDRRAERTEEASEVALA